MVGQVTIFALQCQALFLATGRVGSPGCENSLRFCDAGKAFNHLRAIIDHKTSASYSGELYEKSDGLLLKL